MPGDEAIPVNADAMTRSTYDRWPTNPPIKKAESIH
jgi:hypothetical protein